MTDISKLGSKLIFMKVGVHAQESLEDIIDRKKTELRRAGVIFWGYGGSTCHPLTFVQPFAQIAAASGHEVHMVMEKMNSRHFAPPKLAAQYSTDGVDWKAIPKHVEVRGSRYAMVLDSFEESDMELNLSQMQVACGPNRGRNAAEYVKGRVDKGCFEALVPEVVPGKSPIIRPISASARLANPFAVFLR